MINIKFINISLHFYGWCFHVILGIKKYWKCWEIQKFKSVIYDQFPSIIIDIIICLICHHMKPFQSFLLLLKIKWIIL